MSGLWFPTQSPFCTGYPYSTWRELPFWAFIVRGKDKINIYMLNKINEIFLNFSIFFFFVCHFNLIFAKKLIDKCHSWANSITDNSGIIFCFEGLRDTIGIQDFYIAWAMRLHRNDIAHCRYLIHLPDRIICFGCKSILMTCSTSGMSSPIVRTSWSGTILLMTEARSEPKTVSFLLISSKTRVDNSSPDRLHIHNQQHYVC